MKNFIVARHGSYDAGLDLSTTGKVQIKQLAKALKQVLYEGSVLLLSSHTHCSVQSSRVLSSTLGVPFESFVELRPIGRNHECVRRAMDLILSKSKGFDNVIIMTDLKYTESLPRLFAQNELRRHDFYFYPLSKYEAWRIDCIEKTYKCIS